MEQGKRVYLDWAATAPLCEQAAQAMAPYLEPGAANMPLGANPNSLHSEGREAFAAMGQARESLARVLGARPDEVVFTAGATESNYLALAGIVQAAREKRRKAGKGQDAHVVVGAIEHGAVLQAAATLEKQGVQVSFAPVDSQGRVSPHDIEALLRPETVLVSVMTANNEVGAIQPIAQIARVAHDAGALMHTDAAQALGKIDFDCHALGVDAASFSGHKIGGPKGIGALYLKSSTPFETPLAGGGQESGRRGGTQNVCAMAGFAAAAVACAENAQELERERARMTALRDRLYRGMCEHDRVVPSVECAPGSQDFLPNIANVCVRGFESETLILQLDLAGFAVAGGSACSSHSLEPSKVLLALGLERDLALGSLRVSLGRSTTEQDVDDFLGAFAQVVR